MMIYDIIEDCSPYYIKFRFDNLIDIVNFILIQKPAYIQYTKNIENTDNNWSHERYDKETSDKIISLLPMSNVITFDNNMVALLNTCPGGGSGIHKDGKQIHDRISFNISIKILDDKCITSWYSDETFKGYSINKTLYSRSIYSNYQQLDQFDKLKSMIMQSNEVVLFNTDIYHSWDNTKSENNRIILILRPINKESLYFENAKELLFGIK